MAPERATAILAEMVEALRHESFYVTGTYTDPSLGVYVGWCARAGSFADTMPVKNESGEVAMVLSGEVYTEPGRIQDLRAKGHSFGPQDCAHLVHLYEDAPDFFSELNGLFHGVVVDRRKGSATLFNDRYGMHRLCYHESKDAFYFSAEAKAILKVLPHLRQADPRSLGEFVSCSCVLEDRTIFKDIHALPAGSAWEFREGAVAKKASYFKPNQWESLPQLDSESHYRELKASFSKNLPLYFAGSEPIGMTLTGGFDTRMIMAWHQSSAGSMPCYTFGGMFRESEDVRIARRVAALCRQSHEVITVGDDFLSRFPHYAERAMYLTEGGLDVYRASDLYVSERARKIAPAKVVGTYGSEIVRQAVMFKAQPPPEGLFHKDFIPEVGRAQSTYAELRRENPVTFAAFRQSPWYHQGVLALESSQLTVRSPYLDNNFVRMVYQGTKLNGDIRPRLIKDGSPALARIRTDRGIGGDSGALVSAATHGLMEFTFKAEYAYDYGMPQWLSRTDHALAPLHLERLFLGRHKLTHYRVWYRDVLASYVRDVLLDSRTLSRPYLERKGVETIVEGHTRKGLNYTSQIHKLLSLELFQRAFLD
jgi:asparagine synthase (glutamine-hydrolysing)